MKIYVSVLLSVLAVFVANCGDLAHQEDCTRHCMYKCRNAENPTRCKINCMQYCEMQDSNPFFSPLKEVRVAK